MDATTDPALQWLALALFGVALVHTFAAKQFERLAGRFPRHGGLFHLLGEVEVVFGAWAIVLVVAMAVLRGGDPALRYAESRNYDEPLFVIVVMVVAASRPILETVMTLVDRIARWLPLPRAVASTWLGLAAVPILGSVITEPAAMTIAALMLAPRVFRPEVPEPPKYLALGVLFVNVSIGGTLTAYAAPPVLMVAGTWQWDSAFMFATFGWKAALAVAINAGIATFALRAHLRLATPPAAAMAGDTAGDTGGDMAGNMAGNMAGDMAGDTAGDIGVAGDASVPWPIVSVHLALLCGVVLLAHHPVAFLGLFLMFLGFTQAYERHQSPLILKEALLVGFFLAGLVVLGGMQAWWLQPIVSGLDPLALYFGALGLTAVTDNAALTYLGSLVDGISREAQYLLVAGSVAGGGLTVIANAPNPAGVALLRRGFADESIGAKELLLGALAPTAVAAALLLIGA